MGFPKQEYRSGLPFPSPGDLLNPGTEPVSLTSPALAGRFFTTSTTWENYQKPCILVLDTSEPRLLFFDAPKSLQMVSAAMKLKDTYSLEGKL